MRIGVRFGRKLTIAVVTAVSMVMAISGVSHALVISSGARESQLFASNAQPEQKNPRAANRGRKVEASYGNGLSGGTEGVAFACINEKPPVGSCVLVPAGLRETLVHVEVVDASGLPVPAYVRPHNDVPRGGVQICGATTDPVRIYPGVEVEVTLNAVHPGNRCPGLATTGTVKLTFFRRS